MHKMKLFNSLSRKVEEFEPLNPPHVGFYGCGPTVYDPAHIGNLRTFILYDLIYRVLIADGYKVKFIENLTDIDDKIIKRSVDVGLSVEEVTTKPTQIFFQDLQKLNITPADVFPKATEHVGKMVKYIEVLIDKGLAYEKDGSVYFEIAKLPDYGKLSRIDKKDLKTGTRVLSDEYEKDNVQDFALWKAVESDEFGYDSPWGKGRPGWHIECSVMSQEYLGDTLDIHAGAIDLLFPHHENEIAQAEGKTGELFTKYFVHGEHLLVNGEKMSKSKKNFYTLADLIEKGFDPMAFRYLMLTAHYRSQINFTWESLEAASRTLQNLRETIRSWDDVEGETDEYYEKFLEAVNNDLNLPQAVGIMWEMIRSDNSTSKKSVDILAMDKILGLELDKYLGVQIEIPEEVQKLVDQRWHAKTVKDFKNSDDLRKAINELGYDVSDTSVGTQIKKIK